MTKVAVNLTSKQMEALIDAYTSGGQILQLPESRRHNPAVLSALVKKELLKQEPVGVIWTLTAAGREALQSVY